MEHASRKDSRNATIRTIGCDGFVVSFGENLSESANRAALAFRHALHSADLPGVEESSTSLVSAYLRFDPVATSHTEIQSALETLLATRNWHDAPLPSGRRRWSVPTAFGGPTSPQLGEAAAAAGMSEEDAVASIAGQQVRVQTIGFAPGMPYLGQLSPEWDVPRQTELTARVPAGGLCVAIRQLVLFPVATPTGWRQVGQTALRLFRPDAEEPFLFRPGDEVRFEPVSASALEAFRDDPAGGATCEPVL